MPNELPTLYADAGPGAGRYEEPIGTTDFAKQRLRPVKLVHQKPSPAVNSCRGGNTCLRCIPQQKAPPMKLTELFVAGYSHLLPLARNKNFT